jgi:uncharacterized glyoxalase superfamily metalloenzyme YdcJ
MRERGVAMIDRVQGPPRWQGPDVLLRQTSFRALAEPRTFADASGALSEGTLRVRFGEVEARGIALTARGRDLYDRLTALVEQRMADRPKDDPQQEAAAVWEQQMPRTERELCLSGLGFFTYHATVRDGAGRPPSTLRALVEGGWIEPRPIVYEDFLPGSAAGIFASNLTGAGAAAEREGGAPRDAAWLAGAIGREISRPEDGYAAQAQESLRVAQQRLGVVIEHA